MKSNTFLTEVARKAAFGATAILFVAGSSLFSGCSKNKLSDAPAHSGDRLSLLPVQDPMADLTGL